ncbi:MAG TPA: hypothetical protein VN758_12030 [Solirubrobacterales bacterium]|nr:hypothetical protein [Solirubrobacterales bacterium]
MFRCNQCHTEYGGIRGISIDSCPRCRQQEGVAELRHASPANAATGWRSGESPLSNWSPLPLVGAIAQLDQAARV